MTTVGLINAAGTTERLELAEPPSLHRPTGPLRSRVAYAAAHVIPRVGAENATWDWTPRPPAS